MSDLISRQDAVEAVYNALRTPLPDYKKDPFHDSMSLAVSIVKSIPSAEPERKKGKWEVQPSTGEDRPFIWWKCSECGQVIFSETERDRKEFHAFCGRCGADMRGDE